MAAGWRRLVNCSFTNIGCCQPRHSTPRLRAVLEAQRQLYNAALAERIDAYQRSLLEADRRLPAEPHRLLDRRIR